MSEELDNELQLLREKRMKEREAEAQRLIDQAKAKLQKQQEAEKPKPLTKPIEIPEQEIDRTIFLYNQGILQIYISKKQWKECREGDLIPIPLPVERMVQRGETISRIDLIYRSELADQHLRKMHLLRDK